MATRRRSARIAGDAPTTQSGWRGRAPRATSRGRRQGRAKARTTTTTTTTTTRQKQRATPLTAEALARHEHLHDDDDDRGVPEILTFEDDATMPTGGEEVVTVDGRSHRRIVAEGRSAMTAPARVHRYLGRGFARLASGLLTGNETKVKETVTRRTQEEEEEEGSDYDDDDDDEWDEADYQKDRRRRRILTICLIALFFLNIYVWGATFEFWKADLLFAVQAAVLAPFATPTLPPAAETPQQAAKGVTREEVMHMIESFMATSPLMERIDTMEAAQQEAKEQFSDFGDHFFTVMTAELAGAEERIAQKISKMDQDEEPNASDPTWEALEQASRARLNALKDDVAAQLSALREEFVAQAQAASQATDSTTDGSFRRDEWDAWFDDKALDVLALLSADKTHRVDYALFATGGRVVRSSPTHGRACTHASCQGWWGSWGSCPAVAEHTSDMMLTADMSLGSCWPMKGSRGYAVVELSQRIVPDAVALEHVPSSIAPDFGTAPRTFRVWGLATEGEESGTLLGQFEYANVPARPLQHFALPAGTRAYRYLKWEVLDNFGSEEYTCLYRVRVHGKQS